MRSVLLLLLAGAATAQDPIRGVQEVQRDLGFDPTGNFRRQAPETRAIYRCYYTGKLELPESYDKLHLRETTTPGCPVDETQYDVFYYPAEVVSTGSAPVTSSLAEAPVERQLVVVPHEDFHQTREAKQAPPPLDEAAATLAGFLTAAEYARRQHGEASDLYRNLLREPDLFLRKAEIVNRYYQRLRELYRSPLSNETKLVRKVRLFVDAQKECEAIQPEPVSFNRCLSAPNNAGLAFDYTYTRHYPDLHRLYEKNGRDVPATLHAIRTTIRR
jgi:hypothetical protein